MLSLNSVTLSQKCHLSIALEAFSLPVASHCRARTGIAVHKAIQTNGTYCSGISTNGFKIFGRPSSGCTRLRLPYFQVLSGGNGGGSGGSGDGSSGGGGGSGGGNSGGGDDSNWSLISWYLSLLAKYPVMTKAVTASMLNMVGDIVCQLLIDQVSSVDLKRTFIFTLLGLVMVGPTLHFWYLFLSRLVTTAGAPGAFLRLLLDQFFFSPIFIGAFLSALVTLEGRPSDVMPKLQQEWFPSTLANWKLWIPFQFINFRFVPQQLQVLASNFIALIWNVILSYRAHREVIAK